MIVKGMIEMSIMNQAKDLEDNEKIKIMWVSNSPQMPTGYAKVTREICKRLNKHDEFEIYITGMQTDSNYERNGITVMGVDKKQMKKSVENNIDKINPDVVIILEDTFTMFNNEFHTLDTKGAKLMLYVPMDGDNIPTTGQYPLRAADKIISMSEFTNHCISKEGFDSTVIWHGIDTERFFKPTKFQQMKYKRMLGFEPDDYLIYSFFRNSQRKSPQSLMRSMAQVLSKLPDNYKFHMHTLKADAVDNQLFDYKNRVLAKEFDKETLDRISITKHAIHDDDMLAYIQACDLIVCNSTGEGFGLIMAEGMACGKPIIHNEYSTPHELLIKEYGGIGPRGITVEPDLNLVTSYNVEHGHVCPERFAEAVEDFIDNEPSYTNFGENGLEFAKKYLDWNIIAEQFANEIKKVV